MTDVSRLPGAANHHWDWQLRAACRGADSSLFFHPPNERGDARDEREKKAKRVCGRCPVRRSCLRHALETRERFGVWGGLGERELRTLLGPARGEREERGRREAERGDRDRVCRPAA
ncbi:WhiB family transcriptional regulator [Streptomyces sp. WMMC940]|uniref:WhiB family transcriptional regulator n=1 Tax=Streptomyces sp. WMMC940 TaxID=3015153 RepID=UPI0022B6B3E0|nr:WhiB family transcriptional regulator [Streptomyces sp. WMMC940]MCZ7461815.1 WhiB family transcriptional regulator [Streptomyces sp. WMMC940]